MKRIIQIWMLLKIHKAGLCKPFHTKSDNPEHLKGYCPILGLAYEIIEKNKKKGR